MTAGAMLLLAAVSLGAGIFSGYWFSRTWLALILVGATAGLAAALGTFPTVTAALKAGADAPRGGGAVEDAISALVNLGYRLPEAAGAVEKALVRLGAEARVEALIPEALKDCLVPGMILQPLVENAVKYAVAPSRSPVEITISAREEA